MIVRRGTIEDLKGLLLLGPKFAAHMPYKNAGCDAASILRMLRTSLSQGLLIVAANESPVGCLVGVSMPLWFDCKTKVAVELAWWLEPEYRTGTAGTRMVSLFEQSAHDFGCQHVSMMLMENLQPDRVASLYERRGYRLTERVFVKEISCLE